MFDMRPGWQKEQEERYMKALNEARIRAMNGPDSAQMIAKNDAAFWDYAGKAAPGIAGAAAQTVTDPAVARLRNQGAIATTGMEQAGAGQRADTAARTAVQTTGMEQAGAGQRARLASDTDVQKTGMEVGGRKDVASMMTASDERIAKLREDAASGRLTQQGRQELQQLLAGKNADALAGKADNQTRVKVAEINATVPRFNTWGMGTGTGMDALGGMVTPGSTPTKTATEAELAAYAKAQNMTDEQARAQLRALGYVIQ